MNMQTTLHRTILIDPHRGIMEQSSSAEPIDNHFLRSRVGGFIERVPMARPDGNRLGVDLWIHEEGLYVVGQRFFSIPPYPYPLAGIGVMAGIDARGDSVGLPAWFSLTLLATRLRWIGGAADLEAAILAGHVERPMMKITDENGVDTILWQWSPEDTPERLPQPTA